MFKTPEEKVAYYKGKYDALKEKVGGVGSRFWQSVLDHTIGYAVSAVFIVAVSFGTYYYVSTKVTETVTEIKQDVKDAIPHPIEATKKWLKKEHWWNKDDNKTEEAVKQAESVKVIKEEKEIPQDENQTGFIAKAKEKLAGWKFWEDDNESKEEN